MQKTLCWIAPLNIIPPGGLYLEIALKYKVKQRKNGKFPSNYIRLAHSSLKHIFPSIDKLLQKSVPQKGPLRNINPGAYIQNFMVHF